MSTKLKCRDCTEPKCAECVSTTRSPISRRRFLRGAIGSGLAMVGVGALLSACAPAAPEERAELPVTPVATPRQVPTEEEPRTMPEAHVGDVPAGTGSVDIAGLGTFSFDARAVQTLRPDVFQPGHFSLFDVLAHLGEQGEIRLESHYDEGMDTHVIDAIDGQSGWWYQAHYSRGWYEQNAFRMDMYPYKDDTQFRLGIEHEQRLADIHRTFREEIARLADHGETVVIPAFEIQAPGVSHVFHDVEVIAHDTRSDVLQPGVVTALDAVLGLAEQGKLSNVGLTWYERIGSADPVDSYWVERIDAAQASGGCGFVYETGPRDFAGFSGSHIHIPSDVRVTRSPEYALWFWICL